MQDFREKCVEWNNVYKILYIHEWRVYKSHENVHWLYWHPNVECDSARQDKWFGTNWFNIDLNLFS